MAATTPVVAHGIEGLRSLAGADLGPTAPVLVEQDRIDAFAETTLDRQWINTDPERAAAGPFGATIAHGYLTLSLCSHFLMEMLEVTGGLQNTLAVTIEREGGDKPVCIAEWVVRYYGG